jgi:hypothetical protein
VLAQDQVEFYVSGSVPVAVRTRGGTQRARGRFADDTDDVFEVVQLP